MRRHSHWKEKNVKSKLRATLWYARHHATSTFAKKPLPVRRALESLYTCGNALATCVLQLGQGTGVRPPGMPLGPRLPSRFFFGHGRLRLMRTIRRLPRLCPSAARASSARRLRHAATPSAAAARLCERAPAPPPPPSIHLPFHEVTFHLHYLYLAPRLVPSTGRPHQGRQS